MALETSPAESRRVRKQKAKPSSLGIGRRHNLLAYGMLAPALIGLSIFVIWPLIRAIYLCFYEWNFYKSNRFVGWRNFTNVLKDDEFWNSVIRGFRFTCMVVPVMLIIAFIFGALARSVGAKLSGFLKAIIYIPTVISGVVASLVFQMIYQYPGGIANWLVGVFGVEAQGWLADTKLALAALTLPTIWVGIGLTALIMLSAMNDVPESYYEAAKLDGAGWFRQQRYITLPQMKNIFLYLVVTGFTANMQALEIPMVMTDGGPAKSTLVPNLYIFQHFRFDATKGFSMAAAFILFLVMGGISILIFRLLQSEKAVDV
ncbi:MAG: sugar ABC transporter permease [Bifidobacteriaceae bacterium]|jgi:ABC-type sugar transport system permease subunit|nr:sugar ABC transporter permease [Bifidobacteriaceae bacterium]